ncbi:hypothetical protein WA577_003365 [Blastocystis sp. JDR]
MSHHEWLPSLIREAKEDKPYSRTPEPLPRENSFDNTEIRTESPLLDSFDPSSITFQPYPSSSSSSVSDNGELSEEIVPIDLDNLNALDLDSETSPLSSAPLSPHVLDSEYEKYSSLPFFSVLKQTHLFGAIFTEEERKYIINNLEEITYPKDSILFSQGELPRYLYFIVEGTVELIQSDVRGNSNSLQKMYTGSIIGETDIFNKNRYEYYCVSCDDVTALRLDGVVVRTIIDENKNYEMYLRRSLCSRNWKQMMWINSSLQDNSADTLPDLSAIHERAPRRLPVPFTMDLEISNSNYSLHINQYTLLKEIYAGVNSRIYSCFTEKDHQYYALKSINKHMKSVKPNSKLYRFWGNNAIDSLRTEANILKDLDAPNVVQLFEVIVDNKMNDFILVEELIRGQIIMQESATSQPPIKMTKAVQIFRGILKGVHYLHSKGIVHGDLKVSNVMVENSWEDLPGEADFPRFDESVDSGGVLSEVTTPPSVDKESLLCESPWSPKTSVMSGNASDGESRSVSDCLSPKRYEILEKTTDHLFRQKKVEIIERNENRVRIIDFGVSYDSLKSESSIYGTPMSMPPEVYNTAIIATSKATLKKCLGKRASPFFVSSAFNFGMSRDIWSLGVLLYTMVTGTPPFVGENMKKLSENVLLTEPDYEHKCIRYEYALKDLLKRMLDKNPLTRITLNEVINHEWVTMDGFYPITGLGKPAADASLSPIQASSSLSRTLRSLEPQGTLTTSQRLQHILESRARRAASLSGPYSSSTVDLPSLDPDASDRDFAVLALSREPSTPTHSPHSPRDLTQSPLKGNQAPIKGNQTPFQTAPSPLRTSQTLFPSNRRAEDVVAQGVFPGCDGATFPLSRSASPLPRSGLRYDDGTPSDPHLPPLPPRHMDTVFPTHRTTSLYAEMGSETSSLRASYATNRSASCSFSTSSPLTAAFRHAEADSPASSFASSPRVVVGRGVVSEGYDSNHLGSQYPSLLRQASSDQAPEDLVRTHHVKKLQSAKAPGSGEVCVAPGGQAAGGAKHPRRASDNLKERTASQSSCVSAVSSASGTSDGQKKYEIISSPVNGELRASQQSLESEESDYGEIEETGHIFDNLDTPTASPVSIDAEIAKEFEPLEKGVLPVGSVTGNMVCSDMHLVCAFDSDRNGRETMEDRISLLLSTRGVVPEMRANRMNVSVFCLFDGHGGNDCVDFINNRFISTLIGQKTFATDIVTAIVNTYAELDESFLEVAKQNSFYSGCTSNNVILINTKYEKTIYCVNCGDSQSVLCRNGACVELSVCHNTNNETEVKRVLEMGGQITNGRVMGVMRVTRSLGDIEYKTMKDYYWNAHFNGDLITSVPDICKEHRMRDDEFIITASDGLFDVIPPQACVNFVRRQLLKDNNLDLCCQELLKKAKKLGSHDNISVIIIYLNSTKPKM